MLSLATLSHENKYDYADKVVSFYYGILDLDDRNFVIEYDEDNNANPKNLNKRGSRKGPIGPVSLPDRSLEQLSLQGSPSNHVARIFNLNEHVRKTVIQEATVDNKKTSYFKDGSIKTEEWTDSEGKAHREDGPAIIRYAKDGTVGCKTWMRHGITHREDGPAVIRRTEYGPTVEWYVNGELHREDGPAVIDYENDGVPFRQQWMQHGKHHRVDGPADIWGREDGEHDERWYIDGDLHRENGPALLVYRKGNKGIYLAEESYFLYGDEHRIDGPAVIKYDEAGHIISHSWHRHVVAKRRIGRSGKQAKEQFQPPNEAFSYKQVPGFLRLIDCNDPLPKAI